MLLRPLEKEGNVSIAFGRLVCMSVFSNACWRGQSAESGSIAGTIVDSPGTAMPDVKVTLTNPARELSRPKTNLTFDTIALRLRSVGLAESTVGGIYVSRSRYGVVRMFNI